MTFVEINGKLCAYEIKTEYDNYDRLKTQMKDYMKAFEKVYVIVPAKNYEQVQNFIPLECGIITYKRDNNFNMTFCYRKAAVINNCDIEFCINSLSSVDIVKILKSRSKTIGEKSRKQGAFTEYFSQKRTFGHITEIF